MTAYDFVCNYQSNDKYRQSLNQLTMQTFGFSFEPWYQRGYWSKLCTPHSYLHQGEVIANVMANQMDLIIEGEKRKAIQIGTVMTRPDYRGQGLSAALMRKVLETYEKDEHAFHIPISTFFVCKEKT
ncbi:MAG TPA: GNAT family N-acetyltransferase, partial [Bacillota bacterium]|nr:GNAT family N-acetyltransferase [Bacillota bacterium]